MQSDTSVDAYICDVTALTTSENTFLEKNAEVNVFPNPTGGTFTVSSSVADNSSIGQHGSIDIYNTMGEKIYSAQLNSTKTEIDLTNEPNGIYLIRLNTRQGIVSKKIIKN